MLSAEQIENIYKTYLKTGSYHSTAKICQVSHTTVAKYVRKGDPKRGIPPFKMWALQVNQKVMEESAQDIAKERKDDLTMISGIIKTIARELFIWENNRPVKLKKDPTVSDLEKLVRLKYYLMGEPERKVEVKGEIEKLTQEDILDLAMLIIDTFGKND
jgi:transposase